MFSGVSNAKSDVQPLPDSVVTVFCGTLAGRMHLKYFNCPGIHQSCIEFDGEMISPKEFCVRANKDKQKDWKGSIRAGKRSLRYMMMTKQIEFFNHAEMCSGKCQSRNHLSIRKEVKVVRPHIPVPTYPSNPVYSTSAFMTYNLPPPLAPTFPLQPLQNPVIVSNQEPLMSHNPLVNLQHSGEMSPTMLAAACVGRSYEDDEEPQEEGVMSHKLLLNYIDTDPLMFWNEVRRVGLVPEFLDVVTTEVNKICTTAGDNNANLGGVAPSLSRLVHAVNLQQWAISQLETRQNAPFTVTNPNQPMSDKNASINGKEPELIDLAQQPDDMMNDLAAFFDNNYAAQPQNDFMIAVKQELPDSPSPPRKRHLEMDDDDVPYKKTFVELESKGKWTEYDTSRHAVH